jgi:hypothetical protein
VPLDTGDARALACVQFQNAWAREAGGLVTEVVEAKRGKWERGASAYGARVVNEEERGGKRGGGGRRMYGGWTAS